MWLKAADDDDADDAVAVPDDLAAPPGHPRGPGDVIFSKLLACAVEASKPKVVRTGADTLTRPLSTRSFNVGTADVPGDHMPPPLPPGAAAPEVFPHHLLFGAVCVVAGGLQGDAEGDEGDALAVRLVFVYAHHGGEDGPVTVYLQRPFVPLGCSAGAGSLWRSAPMFPEYLDVVRSLLVGDAGFEAVPVPRDDGVVAEEGAPPPPAHHLVVQQHALAAVAKALLLCFRQRWRPCAGSCWDPLLPATTVSVSGKGQGDLHVWASRGRGQDAPALFADECPFVLWGGRHKRCPLCERLNDLMRKRIARAAPQTPPKPAQEGPAGEGSASEDDGAMEDSDGAASDSDAGSDSDADRSSGGGSDSDAEDVATPGQRLLQEKLQSLVSELEVAEVRANRCNSTLCTPAATCHNSELCGDYRVAMNLRFCGCETMTTENTGGLTIGPS